MKNLQTNKPRKKYTLKALRRVCMKNVSALKILWALSAFGVRINGYQLQLDRSSVFPKPQ